MQKLLFIITFFITPFFAYAQVVPQLEFSATTTKVWEPVTIRATGLVPGAEVTVKAHMDHFFGGFNSSANFIADENGIVDLSKQKPISGDYDFISAQGIFSSMSLKTSSSSSDPSKINPDIFTVSLWSRGALLREGKITRTLEPAESTKVIDLDFDRTGIVGKFFVPSGKGPFPAILTFSGSDGGMEYSKLVGHYLSSQGFAVMVVSYFEYDQYDEKGNKIKRTSPLPETLENIPLEYFGKALEWMKAQPEVKRDAVGIVSASRGGELALLLGSYFSEIKAIVAFTPAHAMTSPERDGVAPEDQLASWTYKGKPLPFVPLRETSVGRNEVIDGPFAGQKSISFTPAYMASYQFYHQQERAATIPVEKINGPLLLLGGDDDQMWPTCFSIHEILKRRNQYNSKFRDISRCYKDVGHYANLYEGFPVAPREIPIPRFGHTLIAAIGGREPNSTAKAEKDTQKLVLDFLRKNLL